MFRFLWAVGTSPNGTDVMDWKEFDGHEKSACANIQLNHTDTYYNTIAAYNKALNSRRSEKTSDGSKGLKLMTFIILMLNFILRFIPLLVTVDLTEPNAGRVTDGQDKNDDVMFSSQAAMFAAHWDNFTDPESGIESYEVHDALYKHADCVLAYNS